MSVMLKKFTQQGHVFGKFLLRPKGIVGLILKTRDSFSEHLLRERLSVGGS